MAKHEILYLVGYNSRQNSVLANVLPIIKAQAAAGKNLGIILMQDGVIGTSTSGTTPAPLEALLSLGVKLYASSPDLQARGIDQAKLYPKITPVTYGDMAEAMASCDKLVSIL